MTVGHVYQVYEFVSVFFDIKIEEFYKESVDAQDIGVYADFGVI